MAVYRVERTRDYTVMSNFHLKDTTLSLKTKGLLSMFLSFPEDWNYSTWGLAAICKEGVDAIGSTIKELEKGGYIVRRQLRGPNGRIPASLARMMKEKGFNVGIMDADITGPSIPKMYGIHEQARGSEEGIYPCIAKDGTRIMSVNLLLEDEDAPVIWRGPILAGVVTQFWSDVIWDDLDYLFVDMPPGTGDVPLTVFQSLPVDGVVIVTSPQDLVQMIVKKAYNMAKQMNIPVLGIVENYSYVKCPDCGKELKIFGESHIDEIAGELGVPVLGRMALDPAIAQVVEEERFYEAENPYLKDLEI